MSGAICAIFIFSSPPGPVRPQRAVLPKVPHLHASQNGKIGRENHPVWKFMILYGNSYFGVGDRRQKGDFGAPRIESRVLDDDWHIRLEYRGIVGIARDRLGVVEIIEAQ